MDKIIRAKLGLILSVFFSTIVAGLVGYFVGREGLIRRIDEVDKTITVYVSSMQSDIQNIKVDLTSMRSKTEDIITRTINIEQTTNAIRRQMDFQRDQNIDRIKNETNARFERESIRESIQAMNQYRIPN